MERRQGCPLAGGHARAAGQESKPLQGLALLLVFATAALCLGIMLPAYAQGQTPETSRQQPSTQRRNTPTLQQQQQRQLQRQQQYQRQPQRQPSQGISSGRSRGIGTSRTGRFGSRDRDDDDDDDDDGEEQRRQQRERQTPPATRRGAAQEGGQRESGQAMPGATGPTTQTRGGPGGTAGAGAREGGGRGAGGTRFHSPAGSTVNVTGEGAYEPAFERDVTYPEVPNAGADQLLTEEGPMPVLQFLSVMHLATNWNIISTPAANEVELNFYIVDTPPKQALKVLEKHKIYYDFEEVEVAFEGEKAEKGFLYVMTEEEYLYETFGELEFNEFKVVHADVTYMESMLSSLLSGLGRIVTDQRTNRIYVWDMKDNLERMVATVEDIDVPMDKRDYLVTHADIADIEGVVTSLLSPNGRVLTDARTGQLVVWDSPTALDQVTETVDRLDVPIEPVTYDIEYLEAEDLIDSIEGVLSERGMIQVDPRYNTIIVTDLPNRQQRIAEIIAVLDRELETRTWTIQYADIDFIADQIETYIPSDMGDIVVNDMIHQITVTGLPKRLDKIEELIDVWDEKRRQVMIQAFLVDMNESVTRELNVRWSYFSSSEGSPVAVNSPNGAFPGVNQDMVTVGRLPYEVPAYGNLELDESGSITRPTLTDIAGDTIIDRFAGDNLAVSLNYLDQTTDSKLLAAPRVTVQDGEEAIFENAERLPFASATTTFSSVNYGNSTSRIEFVDVGIILRVRPRITDKDDILLDIAAEDSSAELVEIESFGTSGTDSVASRKAPQVRARNVETQLRAHSGETLILGGLRQNSAREDISKVPLLGDIPLVGRFFRSPSRASANTTLMIFLTPTIVDEFTDPEAQMLTKTEADIAGEHRHNTKGLVRRILDRISRGGNEIGVSIGQGGGIHSEGKRVTTEELRTALFEIKAPSTITAVIRHHPRAPAEVVTEVTEVIMETGVDIEFDDRAVPLVPAYREDQEPVSVPGV